MQEQLDVFLSHETTPFLERLFDALKSEEYLAHAGPGDGTDTLDPATSFATLDNMTASTVEKSDRECTPPLSSNNNKAKEFDMSLSPVSSVQTSGGVISNASLVSPASTATTTTPIATSSQKRESPVKHGLSGKEDAHARENRRRARSRSRSFDRLRRSRSRERRMAEHNRDKNQHKYRNKSPPGGSLSGSAGERRRGPERRGIRRNRSQSGSRSRSMSPDRKRPSRSISPTLAASKKSQRCRDFDEKGYCMRGETCPWDHGVDPVVLEDLNNPALLNLPGTARPIMSAEYNPYAPDLWSRSANLRPAPLGAPFARHSGGPPGTNFSFMNQSSVQRELIPVPVVGDGNGAAPEGGSIPKRRFEGDDSTGMPEGMMKRKQTMAARLGPRVANQAQQQNCSLELRKIPRGLNQIAHLNNHFSKFGKIVNIQVSYEGDPEAAIVTFSTHAEANVAYRSTEAVLNNRFIKVFWHVPNSSNGDTTPKPDPSAMSLRRGFPNQYHINHKIATTTTAVGVTQQSSTTSVASVQSGPSDPVTGATATSSTSTSTVTVSSSGTITTTSASGGTTSISNKGMTLVNTAAGVAPPNVPIRITNPKLKREVAQLARKQKENAVQVASGLMKKKQTLLEGLIKQMSSTVMLMEKGDVTEAQKFVYISTIKELETKINALKKEISSEQQRLAQVQPTVPMRKTKEQKQKELLDVELDLITQEHVSMTKWCTINFYSIANLLNNRKEMTQQQFNVSLRNFRKLFTQWRHQNPAHELWFLEVPPQPD